MDRRSVRVDGRKIRHLRFNKGWTLRDIAAESRMSPSTATRLENGLPVSLWTLRSVAKALEVSPQDLLLRNESETVESSMVSEHTVQQAQVLQPTLSRCA